MAELTPYEHGIYALDSGYVRPLLDAIHLVVEGGKAALVDTGTNYSLPRVQAALSALGVRPEDVEWVLLTHVHLDHAGGAGACMQAFPNARLAVHPRGARHMADPSRLWAGTVGVYGEGEARRLYGALVPVPAERIVETPHESVVRLGGRELLFLDTPGHARHHVCIVDRRSGCLFSGDTFGLSYRELDVGGRPSVFPTTTPVQFEPDALRRSVELLLSFRPRAIYLTHYSRVEDVGRLGDDLRRLIDAHAALGLRERGAGEARHARLKAGLTGLLLAEGERQGWTLSREALLALFEMDLELNAQGIGVWLDAQGKA